MSIRNFWLQLLCGFFFFFFKFWMYHVTRKLKKLSVFISQSTSPNSFSWQNCRYDNAWLQSTVLRVVKSRIYSLFPLAWCGFYGCSQQRHEFHEPFMLLFTLITYCQYPAEDLITFYDKWKQKTVKFQTVCRLFLVCLFMSAFSLSHPS